MLVGVTLIVVTREPMRFFLFGTCLYRRRAYTQVLFLCKAELGSFSLFRNSDWLAGTVCRSEDPRTTWLVPSASQKIPIQPGWYLPLQKIPLAENRFVQAGKGAENTKEKSRQCFTAEGRGSIVGSPSLSPDICHVRRS
jgi:hypothetical protein